MNEKFRKYSIILIAFVCAVFTRVFILSVYKVSTESMSPLLIPGDFVLASQISYGIKFPWSENTWFKNQPKKGDIVAFSFKNKPSITYLKEIIALEGDVILNSSKKETKLLPQQIYVNNKNAYYSDDSKDLGFIEFESIESRALFIWISISEKNEIRWSRSFRFL